MCGFAGYIDTVGGAQETKLKAMAGRMVDVLRHRGPDDHGLWTDPDVGIALGHRRLAVLDLSIAGHQPMVSPTGRFVVVYNGEIYNCHQIRKALLHEDLSLRFRGHSDTEVMLAAFERWGIECSLARFNGMFAFALWDRQQRVLFLARDRFGEKPLYYGWAQRNFLFGSELKALRAHSEFDSDINRDAVAAYLRFNCIPAPYSVYQNIYKLPPASLLRYSGGEFRIKQYWSLRESVLKSISEPFVGSPEDACDELDRLLKDAVKLRLHADVPLGAFLSGGVDSSLLVALMQVQTERPVRTFSIGFCESAYDEARDAHTIAEYLGTDHTELYVTSDDAINTISRLPEIYDEPFGDSSQIPTLLVSQLTRRYVSVSLSGDGGDEVFGGYNRYTWGGRLWKTFGHIPRSLRRMLASAIVNIRPQIWNMAFAHGRPILPKSWDQRLPGYKLHKVADLLRSADPLNMYERMASHWYNAESVVLGAEPRSPMQFILDQWITLPDFGQHLMYLDTISYLPNDILVKLDRATMAVSLEGRIPYLDHRVVEFAWSLPQTMKIRANTGKWILRQVLGRYLPPQLIERPKMGFGIPLDSWLRGPMRDWAESLLDRHRLQQEGFLNPKAIRCKWTDHLAGSGAWQYHLWDILMFQLWLEHQKSTTSMERT